MKRTLAMLFMNVGLGTYAYATRALEYRSMKDPVEENDSIFLNSRLRDESKQTYLVR